MSFSPIPPPAPSSPAGRRNSSHRWRGWFCITALTGLLLFGASRLWSLPSGPGPLDFRPQSAEEASIRESIQSVDAAFSATWERENLQPVSLADDLTVARRLSLALTGSIPSLEEIRALETQPETTRLDWWTERLLDDARSSDYLAERLARAYVGVENGPFLVFRRRRLVRWLAEQWETNRPYDELVRELIVAEGLWTTNPAANFVTATVRQNEEPKGPDQVKLAIRTTRAFLGVRIDCMQCHDDKFSDRWKQEDFHQLAAFFAGAEMELTGVRDNLENSHEVRFQGEFEERTVLPVVPFSRELMPAEGRPRQKLATWATHPENRAFARTAVNRAWALLHGRPLVEPIDDIPLEADKLPPGMEVLADDFIDHGYDLRRLLRVIAGSRPFRLSSRSLDPENPITEVHEALWAAFPLTRLRPEQVAGSVVQASYLDSLDEEAPFVMRLAKFGQQNDFVKRYGDLGEVEFADQAGTIPQRLLLMNGKLVRERIDENPVVNAVTRINTLAPDAATAVENAYLCVFTRRPSDAERDHFVSLLENKSRPERHEAMQDLYWSLLNATEFSWNH